MSDKPGLRPQEAVGTTLRAIARHILAEARAAIEDRQRIEAVAVHDFRAAMKSWRAFLRLVEPFLDADDRRWRTEARDLARMLAGARDAQAALDAVADAEQHTASHRLSSQSWESIRARLEELRSSAETASLTTAMRSRIFGRARSRRCRRRALAARRACLQRRGGKSGRRLPARAQAHARRLADRQRRRNCTNCASAWWCIAIRWRSSSRFGRGSAAAGSARRRSCAPGLAPIRTWPCWRATPSRTSRWRAGARGCNRSSRSARRSRWSSARRIAARLFAERPKAFRKRLEAMWDGIASQPLAINQRAGNAPASSARTRSMTLPQSPIAGCRNSLTAGYQGLRSRLEQPAPVRLERQQHEGRPAERAGDMGDRGVDADHEIDQRQHRRGVGKVGKLVAEMHDAAIARQRARRRRRAARAGR